MGRGGYRGHGQLGGDLKGFSAETTSLISARERSRTEVDQTLNVLHDVFNAYGATVTDVQIALSGVGANTIAYYDSNGNVAVNQLFFDSEKLDKAYDAAIKKGFHPARGNKTAMEATIAHELGHRLTEIAGVNAGYGSWALIRISEEIVGKAARQLGYTSKQKMALTISGYANANWAETVAEAFSDVYCNRNGAKKESRAIVNRLNDYFNGRGI